MPLLKRLYAGAIMTSKTPQVSLYGIDNVAFVFNMGILGRTEWWKMERFVVQGLV